MLKISYLTLLFSFFINCFSCGYSFTSLKNKWEKEGIETIGVPMFKNDTMEGGVEVYFTNSLRQYLESRSGKLKFVRSNPDAYIEGKIESIYLNPGSIQFGTLETESSGGLPSNRLLAQNYVITAKIEIKMIKTKDKKVLWTNSFSQSRRMESGVFTDSRKSSNVFIKESTKKESIRELADTMMLFAVDSLLEDF